MSARATKDFFICVIPLRVNRTNIQKPSSALERAPRMWLTLIAQRVDLAAVVEYEGLSWSKAQESSLPVVFLKRLIVRA
jgi:hypothetical protein